MISRPMEAVSPIPSPIHRRDTLDPDDHRVRDEIELRYPSTYHYIKDAFCHVRRCKFNGECGRCPADELRRYAARDTDRIGELMRAIKERDDNIAFLRGRGWRRGLKNTAPR